MDVFSFLYLSKIYNKKKSELINFADNSVEIDYTLLAWLNFQSKKFKNKYLLKNADKDFDNLKLQFMLNTLWWSGRVAISKLYDKLELFTFISEKSNFKGEITKATAYHASFLNRPMEWNRIKNLTSITLTNKDSVFGYYNSPLFSGFVEALEFGMRYVRAWKVYDKNVLLAQKMLIFKDGNNINDNIGMLESIKEVKIGISKRNRNSNPFNKDNINSLLSNNDTIETLEFSPNLVELKNAIDNIKSEYDELYGNKTNINFKKERQITTEIDLLDNHFEVLEQDTKSNIELIIKEINKMWNKNYQLIEIDEDQEKETIKNDKEDINE